MTNWAELTQRAGLACHDLVGWMLWDRRAIENYGQLGVPNTASWTVACRLAALGDTPASVAAATTYSIHPKVIEMVMDMYRSVTTADAILAVRDAAVVPGLTELDPELAARLGELAEPLWRGVDAVHGFARPLFSAHRSRPRPADIDPALSAWLAANCIREFRGDNHWALCASEGLDDVEVSLLHAAMIDIEEYGSEEWIARSRGHDDAAVRAAWERLGARGLATRESLSDEGRAFRADLEARTDHLTVPAWEVVGLAATTAFLELLEPRHELLLGRIDELAGARWMPAARVSR